MAGRATQIDQTPFGQHENGVSVGERILVDLRFDLGARDPRVGVQLIHLDFVVEMPDVADDRLIAHFFHVFDPQDIAVAGRRDVNIAFGQGVFDRLHLESFHRGLQRADRVDLGHDHSCSVRTHTRGAAFAHVAVTAYDHHLAGDHHVGRPFDPVGQRFAATVQVVELALVTESFTLMAGNSNSPRACI